MDRKGNQVKTILIAGGLLLSLTSAYAETYLYACHGPDDTKHYAAKLDTRRGTLTYQGYTFRDMKPITDLNDCAKSGGFRATNRDGTGAYFCPATQGVATLEMLVGTAPGGDGIIQAECDLAQP